MPFILVTEEKIPNQIVQSNQTPIFLIPGITGHGNELEELTRKLHQKLIGHPIYIWYHPQTFDTSSEHAYNSLDALAKQIQNDILKVMPTNNFSSSARTPLLIGGYSFGGLLAECVSRQLKSIYPNNPISTLILDIPTPDIIREHFRNQRKNVISELFRIANYCAQLCNLLPKNYLSTDLDLITGETFSDCAEQITLQILGSQKFYGKDVNSLNAYMGLAVQHFDMIEKYNSAPTTKLDSLLIVTTKESREKHPTSGTEAGWKPYTNAETFSSLSLDCTHLDILKQGDAIKSIVDTASTWFNSFLQRYNQASPSTSASNSPFSSPNLSSISTSTQSTDMILDEDDDYCLGGDSSSSPSSASSMDSNNSYSLLSHKVRRSSEDNVPASHPSEKPTEQFNLGPFTRSKRQEQKEALAINSIFSGHRKSASADPKSRKRSHHNTSEPHSAPMILVR